MDMPSGDPARGLDDEDGQRTGEGGVRCEGVGVDLGEESVKPNPCKICGRVPRMVGHKPRAIYYLGIRREGGKGVMRLVGLFLSSLVPFLPTEQLQFNP